MTPDRSTTGANASGHPGPGSEALQRPRVSTATVRDAMHPGIVSCAADTGAAEIARIMSGRGVHSVAVIGAAKDESGPPRVWGIVSDLDVLAAITAPRPYPTAADLATQPVITVRPDLPLSEAVEAMVRYGAHHVVVAEPDRHTPVGILSTLDVAAVLARDEQ